VADHARRAASEFEADLRELRGLSRAGFSAHDADLMRGDHRGDLGAARGDRECVVKRGAREQRASLAHFRERTREPFAKSGHSVRAGRGVGEEFEELGPVRGAGGVDLGAERGKLWVGAHVGV
jgi:hypothetical protein